jgi:hypothetical protein
MTHGGDDDGSRSTGRAGGGFAAAAAVATAAGNVALEALALSRAGDVAGALALLRAARDNGPLDEAATSLLFNLLQDIADDEDFAERLALCDHGLSLALRPVTRSSWHLRRGTLHLAARHRAGALADLQAVLRLKASDDHTTQAQKALLAVAELPAPTPPRRRP